MTFARSLKAALLACALTAPAVAADVNTTASLVYYDAVGNETLDPAEPQSGSSFSQEVLLAIFDTLVRLDDAGNTTPGLALSWKAAPDLMSFTFTLRPRCNTDSIDTDSSRNAAAISANTPGRSATSNRT